jgi:3-phenylpropionate/cinnamic acid dioxygenase small subunit
MTVALAAAPPPGLARVRGLYDSLAADRATVAAAGPGDMALVAPVAAFLAAECRWLDGRSFDRWLAAWTDDAAYWVPLGVHDHPAEDQALFFDDRRRLGERVWRMSDASAWALTPAADTVRMLGGVEAWPDGDGVLASSSLHVTYRRGPRVMTMAARQIHRLAPDAGGFRIRRKTLLIPELAAGMPHLGWLL